MFFNRNPNELTSRSHSGLVEEFLNHRLDGTFGNPKVICNLYVREPVENASRHFALAGRERLRAFEMLPQFVLRFEERMSHSCVQPYLAFRNLMDCDDQLVASAALEKYS